MDGKSKRNRVARPFLCAGLLVLASAILFLFNPESNRFFPPCPSHLVTELHCPGCGSLRALHNLLNGNLVRALSLNPLLVVCIPIVGLMFLKPSWTYRRWVPWTALAVLVGFAVLRNLPVWPFELLAPQ